MNDESFCGFPLRNMQIPGLRFSIEETYHAKKLVIYDKRGVLWEVRQILFSGEGEGRVPLRISLYHRNRDGKSMHYQKYSAKANYGGVERILLYIHQHEQFKARGKRKWEQ